MKKCDIFNAFFDNLKQPLQVFHLDISVSTFKYYFDKKHHFFEYLIVILNLIFPIFLFETKQKWWCMTTTIVLFLFE